MKKNIIVLTICILLSACHNVPMWKYSMFERPSGNVNYPPLYIKGWQDGCESGAQASSNHLYRLRYKFRQDWTLLNDAAYIRGWQNAYNQCRKYILQYNLDKIKRS